MGLQTEHLANDKEISAVPFWMKKRGLLQEVVYNFPLDFLENCCKVFHLTFNWNFWFLFLLNGKHPSSHFNVKGAAEIPAYWPAKPDIHDDLSVVLTWKGTALE